MAALSRELVTYVENAGGQTAGAGDPPKHDPGLLRIARQAARAAQARAATLTTTLIMRELPQPRETYIHLGGDFTAQGRAGAAGVPAVLAPKLGGGNRLDLARWLVDRRNPLTARVTVNRMWQAYFGKGMVETENDFGADGREADPSGTAGLAGPEFMASGWSQKAIHRLIVTSATYRQSSRSVRTWRSAIPTTSCWRAKRGCAWKPRSFAMRRWRRAAADPAVGGPSVYPPIPDGAMAGTQVQKAWPTAIGPDRYRRGLYTFFFRSPLHPGLVLFDAPDGAAACTRRVRSNSPLQALTLLNDEAFVEVRARVGGEDSERRRHGGPRADRLCIPAALGRKPSRRRQNG